MKRIIASVVPTLVLVAFLGSKMLNRRQKTEMTGAQRTLLLTPEVGGDV